MTGYKTILACVRDEETAIATLKLAFLVGRNHGSHIEALNVTPDSSSAAVVLSDAVSELALEEIMSKADERAKERTARLRGLFEEACAQESVPITASPSAGAGLTAVWQEKLGIEAEVVAKAGRFADLTIMARPMPDHEEAIMSLNAALMESGRPMLLAPPVPPPSIGRRVAVLWNASPEASRAVAAAMPLLRQAESVTILTAAEEGETGFDGLAAYLARHGVQTTAHTVTGSGSLGKSLLDEARALESDLIVMGAYTHSRLRQLIMGGVTRHMLHMADLPVFLSH